MIEAFQARRDLVVEGLRKIAGIRCQMPKGAFYVFPNVEGVCEHLGIIDAYSRLPADVRALTTPSTLLQMFLLFEYQVATMDRKSFGRIGTEKLHYLRLSIATDIDSLREAVSRIAEAAKDAAGFERFLRKGENLSMTSFGPRRALFLDVQEEPHRGARALLSEQELAAFERFDLLYRSLCAMLYNYVPTSGHPGGSISSGRFASCLAVRSNGLRHRAARSR